MRLPSIRRRRPSGAAPAALVSSTNSSASAVSSKTCLVVAVLLMAASPYAMAVEVSRFPVAEAQIKALGIQTTPLKSGGESVRMSFPAQVLVPPNAEQVVSSSVAGLVAQVMIDLNQEVAAGTPLLRITSPEFGELQLQLLQANSRATLARLTAEREKQLFDEGIVAARRKQEAEAALSEADAAFKQAKAALRLSGMSMAVIQKVIASGDPQDSLTLVAANAGIVSKLIARVGERVDAAAPLVHVIQAETLWLDIQVPANERAAWPVGTSVGLQGRKTTGRLTSSGLMVSPDSQTVVLRAALEKAEDVRPGEFVTASLPAPSTDGGWDLPLVSVAHDGDKAVVFVRTADGFEARPVSVTASAGQRVRVKGRLAVGDAVAVSGVIALKGAWLNSQEEAP